MTSEGSGDERSGANLVDQLRRLGDLEEIKALQIAYGYHLDRGRWAEYAALFARDGKLRLGPVRADGREAIEIAAREELGFHPTGDSFDIVHLVANPRIELDGDRATGEVTWTVVSRTQGGEAAVTSLGRHLDDYVREDGRWRIQRRRGFRDIP
jgi:3-phenylpropionate/cinnamic acid dioxygenase small subunit